MKKSTNSAAPRSVAQSATKTVKSKVSKAPPSVIATVPENKNPDSPAKSKTKSKHPRTPLRFARGILPSTSASAGAWLGLASPDHPRTLSGTFRSKLVRALKFILREFKWFFILAGLYFLAKIILFFVFLGSSNSNLTYVTLNGHTYHVQIASTNAQLQQGLMNYRKPVPFDGMIFIFPQAQVQSFWNKNTHLDLDIYWMKGNKVIGQISLPSTDRAGLVTVHSPEPVDKVVEIIK